jgi:hypothetical protein
MDYHHFELSELGTQYQLKYVSQKNKNKNQVVRINEVYAHQLLAVSWNRLAARRTRRRRARRPPRVSYMPNRPPRTTATGPVRGTGAARSIAGNLAALSVTINGIDGDTVVCKRSRAHANPADQR